MSKDSSAQDSTGDEKELSEFLANFDLNGFVEEMREKTSSLAEKVESAIVETHRQKEAIKANIKNAKTINASVTDSRSETNNLKHKVESEIVARGLTEDALKSTLARVEKDNDRLRSRLADEWNIPKILFAFVITFSTVLFGVEIYRHATVVIELKDLEADLNRQYKSNSILMNALTNSVGEKVNEANALGMKELTKQFNNEIVRKWPVFTEVEETAHKISSLTGMARHQLVAKHDARRALFYVNKANAKFEAVKDDLNENGHSELFEILNQTKPLLVSLEAECYLKLKEYDSAINVSEGSITQTCDCPETQYILGLAQILEALKRNENSPERNALFKSGEDHLGKAISDDGLGDFSNVLLAAISLKQKNPDSAIKKTKLFIKGYPKSRTERGRLNSQIRSQIQVAETLLSIAKRLNGDPTAMQQFSCEIKPGTLEETEGILLEKLLALIIEKREQYISRERDAYLLGIFCMNFIDKIRYGCGSGGACAAGGCGAVVAASHRPSQDLIDHFRIDPSIPPLSKDKTLGKIIGNKLHMVVSRVQNVKEKRSIEQEDGSVVDVDVDVLTPVGEKVVTFAVNEELPEDRYKPYELPTEHFSVSIPDLSTNKALGWNDGKRLRMLVVQLEARKRTRTFLKEDGTPGVEEYEVHIPVEKEVDFDPTKEIPEGRYKKYLAPVPALDPVAAPVIEIIDPGSIVD